MAASVLEGEEERGRVAASNAMGTGGPGMVAFRQWEWQRVGMRRSED
jgi:hypothetical protein